MANTSDIPVQKLQIFSDELIALLGEEVIEEITDQICSGLNSVVPTQKATSLCIELIVFEMNQDILEKLIKCVFAQLNPILITQEILQITTNVNHVLNNSENAQKVSSFTISKFEILDTVIKKIKTLEDSLIDSCDLPTKILEEILIKPLQIPTSKLTDLYYIIDNRIIQQFRETLTDQYDNFALKLCNKVSCIYSDIEFLSEQIKQVTNNFPAAEQGIIEIADAAADVAQAFFSEQDDFNHIYAAVDEVSKLIEDLADFYKKKLDQLEHLLSMSNTGCPVPIKAREILPSIPETPSPPPVFPIVALNTAFTSPVTAQFTPPTIL